MAGLRIENIDLTKAFHFHQPALSYVFSGPPSTARLPTQLVFPDGRVALGCTPTGWRNTEEEEEESRISRLRSGPVVAYASVDVEEPCKWPLRCVLTGVAFFIALQMLVAAVTLSGGYLFPFAPPSANNNPQPPDLNGSLLALIPVGSASQRRLYSTMLVLHVLPIIGVLYRLPAALILYNAAQMVFFSLIFATSLFSVLDVLVLLSTVAIRLLGEEVRKHTEPQIFSLQSK